VAANPYREDIPPRAVLHGLYFRTSAPEGLIQLRHPDLVLYIDEDAQLNAIEMVMVIRGPDPDLTHRARLDLAADAVASLTHSLTSYISDRHDQDGFPLHTGGEVANEPALASGLCSVVPNAVVIFVPVGRELAMMRGRRIEVDTAEHMPRGVAHQEHDLEPEGLHKRGVQDGMILAITAPLNERLDGILRKLAPFRDVVHAGNELPLILHEIQDGVYNLLLVGQSLRDVVGSVVDEPIVRGAEVSPIVPV